MNNVLTVEDAIIFISKTNAKKICIYKYNGCLEKYEKLYILDKEDLEIPLSNILPIDVLDKEVDSMYIYPAIEGVIYYEG